MKFWDQLIILKIIYKNKIKSSQSFSSIVKGSAFKEIWMMHQYI